MPSATAEGVMLCVTVIFVPVTCVIPIELIYHFLLALGFHVVFQRDPTLSYLLGRVVFLTQGCEVCQALQAEGQKLTGWGQGWAGDGS